MTPSIQFSCVLDPKDHFIKQTVLWVSSLLESNTAQSNEIIVHSIGIIPASLQQYLNKLGVKNVKIEAFGTHHKAYCNKLQQLNSSYLDADVIVLCDTDIVFAENVRDEFLNTQSVKSKIVDLPNPPLNLIDELAEKLSLEFEIRYEDSSLGEKPNDTVEANCNGGLYVIHKAVLSQIKDDWIYYANKILEQEELLTQYTKHADQLGFSFAILKNEVRIDYLNLEYNYPLHIKRDKLGRIKPKIIHYHDKVTESGKILCPSYANKQLASTIRAVNRFSLKYRKVSKLFTTENRIRLSKLWS